jgi:T5orf172 domain
MRIFFRFPRVFGISPGVSFGPEDFRQRKTAPRTTSRHADSDFAVVYVIKGDHNRVKIGITKNPRQRLLALKTSSPFPLEFAFLGMTDTNGYTIERGAHDRLAAFREGNTEWFACSPELAGAAIMASAAEQRINLHPTSMDIIEKVITIGSGASGQKHSFSIISTLTRIVVTIISLITMFFGFLLLFFALLSLLKSLPT